MNLQELFTFCDFGDIVEEELTEKDFIKVVEYIPECIHYIPLKYRTYKVCERAVQLNGLVLFRIVSKSTEQFSKEELNNIFKEATKNEPQALRYVPEESQTLEMCVQCLHKDPSTSKYIKIFRKGLNL